MPFWLLLITLPFLSSCLEYSDHLAVDSHGKGSFQMELSIPADLDLDSLDSTTDDFFQSQTLRARFESIEGLHLDSMIIYTRSGKKNMRAYLRFDHLQALALAGGRNPQENFIGELQQQNQGDTVLFKRYIHPYDGRIGPEDRMDSLTLGMMQGLMSSIQWNYSLTVPGALVEAYPSPTHVDSAAGQVVWNFPIQHVAKQPIEMWVRYIPQPAHKPSLLPLVLSVLVMVIALFFLNRKMRRLSQVLAARKQSASDSPQ